MQKERIMNILYAQKYQIFEALYNTVLVYCIYSVLQKLGITPLHIAVALPHGAVPISKLLLEAGADPNLRDFAFEDNTEEGRTSLHTACCREDNDKVSFN